MIKRLQIIAILILSSIGCVNAQNSFEVHKADSLNEIASTFAESGNLEEAIKIGTRATEIYKKQLGVEHEKYGSSLIELCVYYKALGNNTEAERLINEYRETLKNVYGPDNIEYAGILERLGNYHAYLGNYQEALKYTMEMLEIMKKDIGTENIVVAMLLAKIANFYSTLGNYQDALAFGTEALEIMKKTHDPGSEILYASVLNVLANSYNGLGNYHEAIKSGSEALEIMKKTIGTVEEKDFSNASKLYATLYVTLVNSYNALDNYEEAVKYGLIALDLFKENGIEDIRMVLPYTSLLRTLAESYIGLENYQEAIKYCTESIELIEETFGTKHPSYAMSLNTLSICYFNLDEIQEAASVALESKEIMRKSFGEWHPSYAALLGNLSFYNLCLGDISNASMYENQSVGIYQADILSKFSDMIAYERELYWDGYEYSFNSLLPVYLWLSEDETFTGTVYDKSALFAKGILLSAETEMSTLIQESGDKAALEKYETLRQNRAMLNKLLETPIAERQMNTDSLQAIVDKQESELVSMSKVYGDYTKNLRLTWKDVQSKLPADGIAVEFLSFPIPADSDSIMYIALTLRKDYDMPKMTVLFEQKDLTTCVSEFDGQDVYLPSENLTNLIWQPLADELKGVKKIYFAPSGLLHSIGIEYLPGMEDYSIYRLSSTRELALNRSNENSKGAALYGGIKYDTDINTMLAEARAVKSGRTNSSGVGDTETDNLLAMSSDTRSVVSSMHLRSQASYLPGTKTEVEDVNAALKGSAVGCTMLTGSNATEESFKALGGKRTKILHIATHGFYYTPEEADNNRDFKFLQLHIGGSDERRYVEDKVMTRSGLLFAGANNALDGKDIPEGLDDGILTAKEISQIDLRGLDLVTLSACQTGLGDISQGEGVFGLQRAFKKAGAQTIVVSLWKVDDKATQILMSSFYGNIAKGIDKHSAFLQAQQHLRTIDGGRYNDPKYWAAFIILDATE